MPCGFHVNEWFKIWTCNSVSNPDGMPEWCHNWISRASLHLCHPGLACSSDIDRHQHWPLHKVAIGQVIVELSRECARSLDVCSVPGRLHTGETLPGWWSHSFLQTGLYCWFLCFLSSQETCTALPPTHRGSTFLIWCIHCSSLPYFLWSSSVPGTSTHCPVSEHKRTTAPHRTCEHWQVQFPLLCLNFNLHQSLRSMFPSKSTLKESNQILPGPFYLTLGHNWCKQCLLSST